MAIFSEAAPAKINLFLHVVGKRPDGYHLLHSLVSFAAVGDVLTAEHGAGLTLSVTGPFAAGLTSESDNLVLRAARALAEWAGLGASGKLVLQKNLPVASGIGGGSADAAAALRVLCRLWGIDPGSEALFSLARGLGADVPVCLAAKPSIMLGIGERLSLAPPLPTVGLVLVNPGVPVATATVFKARIGLFSDAASLPATGWRDSESFFASLSETTNDLEEPAIRLEPVIGAVLAKLRSVPNCRLARMSGSGATCFGLFPSEADAVQAANCLKRPDWWVWGGGFGDR